MRSSFILLVTIIPVAGLALFAFFRYRKRLDQAVSENSTASERQHRSASPAEFLPWLLIILLVIWNAVLVGKVSSMSNSLDLYGSNIQSQLYDLRSQIHSLKEKLDAENSQLLAYDFEFSRIDSGTDQVEILYTLTPATLPENARLSLRSGTQTVPCEKQADGSFTAVLKADLFAPVTEYPLFVVEENGTEHRQVLDKGFTGYPYEAALPNCLPGGMNLKGGLKKGTLSLEGLLKLSVIQKTGSVSLQSLVLKKQAGSEFTGTIPVTLSEDHDADLTLDEHISGFPSGTSFNLWAEIRTDAGYLIRSLIVSMDADNDYSPVMNYGTDVEVYSENGSLLFRYHE